MLSVHRAFLASCIEASGRGSADSRPAGTWRCCYCSVKCVQLRRIFKTWPTDEFLSLSEASQCPRIGIATARFSDFVARLGSTACSLTCFSDCVAYIAILGSATSSLGRLSDLVAHVLQRLSLSSTLKVQRIRRPAGLNDSPTDGNSNVWVLHQGDADPFLHVGSQLVGRRCCRQGHLNAA